MCATNLMMKISPSIRRISPVALALLLLFSLGCNPLVLRFTSRAIDQISEPTRPVAHKVATPIRPDVGLSVLWVGHATVLIQIHDKLIITDPVFTKTIGLLAKRSIDAGLDPSAVTRLDAILISHVHFDHFSYGSLDLLPKSARLFVPSGGIEYTPEFGFAATLPMKPWQAFEKDGLRITAVPVQHFGGRYGFDAGWNEEPTWTGYVIEYRGSTVFFAGDTRYDPEIFKEIGRRFQVDVALIPIAPIEPRDFMGRVHTDPKEALQVFEDVGAKVMIPIHHDTFFQGLEPTPSYAKTIMQKLVEERGLQQRVKILDIGEQIVLKE
jgi:N-acyl-phosphatidylethanolamine-hydrolysing phospholipase D